MPGEENVQAKPEEGGTRNEERVTRTGEDGGGAGGGEPTGTGSLRDERGQYAPETAAQRLEGQDPDAEHELGLRPEHPQEEVDEVHVVGGVEETRARVVARKPVLGARDPPGERAERGARSASESREREREPMARRSELVEVNITHLKSCGTL
jgi:hypothetical protein